MLSSNVVPDFPHDIGACSIPNKLRSHSPLQAKVGRALELVFAKFCDYYGGILEGLSADLDSATLARARGEQGKTHRGVRGFIIDKIVNRADAAEAIIAIGWTGRSIKQVASGLRDGSRSLHEENPLRVPSPYIGGKASFNPGFGIMRIQGPELAEYAARRVTESADAPKTIKPARLAPILFEHLRDRFREAYEASQSHAGADINLSSADPFAEVELSGSFHRSDLKAQVFLERRCEALGIQDLPASPLDSLIFRNQGFSDCSGAVKCGTRLMSIQASKDDMSNTGILVHERIHAAGYVKYTLDAKDNPVLMNAGWIHDPSGKAYFVALEEGTAFLNEYLYLTEAGASEIVGSRNVESRISNTSAGRDLLRAHTYAFSDRIPTESELDALFANGDAIPLSSNITEIETQEHRSCYAALGAALVKLAPELYPEAEAPKARELLTDDLTKAQISGNYVPFFKRVRQNLDPDAVKFLALIRLDHDGKIHETTHFLHLFADAAELPADKRVLYRKALINYTFEKYKPKWVKDVWI